MNVRMGTPNQVTDAHKAAKLKQAGLVQGILQDVSPLAETPYKLGQKNATMETKSQMIFVI